MPSAREKRKTLYNEREIRLAVLDVLSQLCRVDEVLSDWLMNTDRETFDRVVLECEPILYEVLDKMLERKELIDNAGDNVVEI